jgi:hypothetical protein
LTVQRRYGLTVIRLRGRIDDSLKQLLTKTLVTELARRRLKLLTIHLDTNTTLNQTSYSLLVTAERVARARGKGFGIVYGPHIAGSILDLPDLKPATGNPTPPQDQS